MNEENMIRVWKFEDAPPMLQSLSTRGGDEDWLAVLPESYKGEWPLWMEEGSSFGCYNVSKYELPGGRLVLIGAHA